MFYGVSSNYHHVEIAGTRPTLRHIVKKKSYLVKEPINLMYQMKPVNILSLHGETNDAKIKFEPIT